MPFWQLTVPAAPETADALTNFLWEQGALGVVEEQSESFPPRLRAFFAGTASSTTLLHAVNTYCASLRFLGFATGSAEPEITPLLDGEWASAWQQSFPPLEVGERLLIVPPWEARDDATAGSRVQVIIEPGRAFGTGHHGSTEGCLVLLEKAVRSSAAPPSRALDVGTGTGILAISAVKLGVRDVLAVDIDPDAIAAARLNAEKNGCADRITIELGSVETLPGAASSRLVLANLLTHTHLALLPHYARLTAPEGLLVLGGILAEEAERVERAFEAAGFERSARLTMDGWASLSFTPRD
jgi:ribosomal protein L11 methyltransferase